MRSQKKMQKGRVIGSLLKLALGCSLLTLVGCEEKKPTKPGKVVTAEKEQKEVPVTEKSVAESKEVEKQPEEVPSKAEEKEQEESLGRTEEPLIEKKIEEEPEVAAPEKEEKQEAELVQKKEPIKEEAAEPEPKEAVKEPNPPVEGVDVPAKEPEIPAVVGEQKGKTEVEVEQASPISKSTAGEKKQPAPKSTEEAQPKNDTAFVKQRMEELKVMKVGPTCVEWIDKHVATRIVATRILGRERAQSTDELDKYFVSTLSQFISANIASFLPLIQDYAIIRVAKAQSGQSFVKYSITLRDEKTGENFPVEVIATVRGLRIVDITAQATSLLSILKTAVQDILALPKDQRRAAWDRVLAGPKA